MDSLTSDHWERFEADPQRVAIADQVCFVYRLVENKRIEEARSEWRRITQETRAILASFKFIDPHPDFQGHVSITIILSHIWSVIDNLHISTNTTLQTHWRDVTNALFVPPATDLKEWM